MNKILNEIELVTLQLLYDIKHDRLNTEERRKLNIFTSYNGGKVYTRDLFNIVRTRDSNPLDEDAFREGVSSLIRKRLITLGKKYAKAAYGAFNTNDDSAYNKHLNHGFRTDFEVGIGKAGEKAIQNTRTISSLTVVTTDDSVYLIVLNELYDKPIKVRKNIKAWAKLYELATSTSRSIPFDKYIYDYMNSNSSGNILYKQSGFARSHILAEQDHKLISAVPMETITHTLFLKRKART